MFENDKEIAAAIEDGTYFREGHSWYEMLYISVISERYFFLGLCAVAVFTMMLSVFAYLSMLPLDPRMPFLYQAKDAFNEIPLIKPIKTYKSQDINDAMRRFYVTEYVNRREGYSSNTVNNRLNFVHNYSDPAIYGRYSSYLDLGNPRSPIQKFGNAYNLVATTDPSTIDIVPIPTSPGKYNVGLDYSVDLYSQKLEKSLRFHADMTIDYKDLIVDQTKDMDGKGRFDITPMVFKVTAYRFNQIR